MVKFFFQAILPTLYVLSSAGTIQGMVNRELKSTVIEAKNKPSEEEVLSQMRIFAELVLEAWKNSVKRQKASIQLDKTDLPA